MFLEIVTPEAVLFSSEVDSVAVPGINGEFQMLNNHAPIVSILTQGTVKIHVHTQEHGKFDDLSGHIVPHADDDKILTLAIKSGTLEMKGNKVIVLAD
ncbi:FoF1 ATP synthase subunit delta/epsilon [Tenacibaculum maritimum]|uniref:H+-transporting two-sector ATPase, epsilon subunit n=1 Tax=Tenacibaculum maritimum NCIMB 2154 TaxID=1349785 RepID=A0A2H1ED87_9FLAO|nr:F0F1 ATP synthase subunit epsilon [Tenacibaculum maritimum]MCD9563255.1 F0F1 ATP synthase subunit epsilon [Tenacibaculum maritimum]MCD9566084.1 F0F1 ATP synthase subunit epsilon [Tenacibaculum maritimum]MCD9578429.1 F0F1 ATP synthase subunit epsilon [Tenacibaculum maritimum]MCD9581529.1 F0F1 ATP synthase subunit epsilon [Tenacibaculum maritimum]MCD9584240.1 F0F1 ATP synthase subunit epsilon [Tenacibaculum maritimum]